MNEVRRHPIDFDELQPGSSIPAAIIERVTETKREDYKDYKLALLKMSKAVQTELVSRGRPWRVVSRGDDLFILTDSEAMAYADRRFQRNLAGLAREHAWNLQINTANLTLEERQEHERTIIVQSKFLQSIKGVKRELRLASHTRSTPGLPKKEGE